MSMATYQPRLPVPAGVSAGEWRVLTEVIFPTASSAEGIMLAVEYCRVRNLDVMKRPINIVGVWSNKLGRNVDTIWVGIGETQITAARSKEWAGLDPARYGIAQTQTFSGEIRVKGGGREKKQVTLTYPEWCEVTVYRMVGGQRHAFTERVYWLEAYGRQGGSIVPNDMWSKRPYGQFAKVAKAASLRAAFPEESAGPTDEEMAGATIDEAQAPDPVHHALAPIQKPEDYAKTLKAEAGPGADGPPHNPETGEVLEAAPASVTAVELGEEEAWQSWGHRFLARLRAQTTLEGFNAVLNDPVNVKVLEEMTKDGQSTDGLMRAVQVAKLPLLKLQPQPLS